MKDPNELLVAQGPESFARTFKRLVSEASGNARVSAPVFGSGPAASAAAPVPLTRLVPVASVPAAAKEEKLTEASAAVLEREEATGAYLLAFSERTFRMKGLSAFGVDRMRVNLRVDQGPRFHVDTFDLYSSRSRSAFIESAKKVLQLESDEGAEASLSCQLAAVIDALEKERLSLRRKGETKAEPAVMTPEAQAEAMAFLMGDIRAQLREDFPAVGIVGEEEAVQIGYFALVSRKLQNPLSILFCARSGAGKSALQDRLCDLCPPEDLERYTRISGQVLFYKGEDALKHKLLAVDEEDGAAQAAYALRSLLSNGYLTCSVTRTDPATGKQVDDNRRVNGPTATFTTTAHPEGFDYETRNRYVLVTIDESREQTKRILEQQRRGETVEGLIQREMRQAIFKRHHDAQRLLRILPVVIPVKIDFPSSHLILRREHRKYLSLIEAIALLHQYQRPRRTVVVGGKTVEYVEATQEDVEMARPLAALILRRNLDELAPPSRSLFQAMQELAREKRRKLGERKPGRDVGQSAGGERESASGESGDERDEAGGPRTRRYFLGPRPGEHGERDQRDQRDERLFLDRREIQRATGLSLWHIKTYMPQLIEYEYVALVTGRKGKRCLYEVVWGEEEEPLPEIPA